jgi:hypothetical protein
MASVTSLDADMRNLRMSRYTPQAANEARSWIESALNIQLPTGNLLEDLKDGVILCQLANLAIQPQHPPIKFKKSAMPFIQMENISHFLKACEMAPLNLPAHDRFLTVDLFEAKDAAQVLQCLGAFSRQANRINPTKFTSTIGPKKAGPTVPMTPPVTSSITGSSTGAAPAQVSSPTTSSWSKRAEEGSTAPAWNIHQYGYMGGASQGNQGITFGGRRQITSQAPEVPSLAEKEKTRREKELEASRRDQQDAEDREHRRLAAAKDEENARLEEARKWEEETARHREEERTRIEQQKRQWEEEERIWKADEEAKQRESATAQSQTDGSHSILRGQTMSQYRAEQASRVTESPEQKRVRELEKELAEARERERQYQAEREERMRKEAGESTHSVAPQATPTLSQSDANWAGDERDSLRKQRQNNQDTTPSKPPPFGSPRPLPTKPEPAPEPSFAEPPAPTPAEVSEVPPSVPARNPNPPFASTGTPTGTPNRSIFGRPRPVPNAPDNAPSAEASIPNRTDQFLDGNAAPTFTAPRISSSNEAGDTSLEQARDRDTRLASQEKTKAGAWASKSLLEREMERERERQREWESHQQAQKDVSRDTTQGTGQGQTWDVNQYGYLGGDNMNRGSGVGSGINIGGRRQIIGPRPKP